MRKVGAMQGRGRWMLGICVSVLALTASLPACAGGSASSDRSRTVVSYREEGGIGGPRGSLIVSSQRRATVAVKGGRVPVTRRLVRFRLGARLWRRLRGTLRRADLEALAGSHFPSTPIPDAITYVVSAGGNTVRTSDGAIPRRLGPLLNVLRRIVAIGERRLKGDAAR
jgi:hypothetical protein